MTEGKTHWFIKAMEGDINLVEALNTPVEVLNNVNESTQFEFPVSGDLIERYRAKKATA